MPHVDLRLNGDGCWPDLAELRDAGRVIDTHSETSIGIALLPGGMTSGKPSVTFRLQLPDGKIVLAQTSLELLTASVRAMNTRMEHVHKVAWGDGELTFGDEGASPP
jgi:hypothetical protein